MRRLALVAVVVALMSLPAMSVAQDAVPSEILQRTFFIKAGTEGGTAFAVDYKGRMYLVTARHVVAGLPTENATIQVWKQGEWQDYHTVKTIFPSSTNADIAVFETNETVSNPFAIAAVDDTSGPSMGQHIWFLGYPFGISSRFSNGNIAPFIKSGTMSAVDATDPDSVVVYIDGFNNPGFSGGPVLYWDFSQHKYKILAVVSGYKEDSAKILVNGQQVDTQLLVNTGILLSYSITHAMKAIEESQKQADSTK